jgi:membrane associated rhomboid family serine protease
MRSRLPSGAFFGYRLTPCATARASLESIHLAFLRPHGVRPSRGEPIINMPPATQALLLANFGVHLVRQLLPARVDDWLVVSFGFIPASYTLTGGFSWEAVVSPVTHMLLHASWPHLLANMLALLVLGVGVERWLGPGRMLAFTLFCGLAGAAAQYFADPESVAVVIGASGAISGLFGGFVRILPRRRPARALLAVGIIVVVWVGGNLEFGLSGLPNIDSQVAWVAHLGGFAAGLIFFGLFEKRRQPAA